MGHSEPVASALLDARGTTVADGVVGILVLRSSGTAVTRLGLPIPIVCRGSRASPPPRFLLRLPL